MSPDECFRLADEVSDFLKPHDFLKAIGIGFVVI